jgi:hypothetical protein
MRFGKFIAAAAIAGFTMVASFGPTTAKETAAPPEGAQKAQLAATLAAYGMANHDPATLLAAAHIINGLKSNVGTMKGSTAAGTKPAATYDPLSLLKLAKSYATGPNASLASAIDTEMKNVSATQAVCYYQYYCNAWGYCWYEYYCY